MKWSVGTKIGAGFALALVALIVIGATSYLSINRFLQTAHLVDHTYQVINRIDRLLTELINVETGQRGYIITHDDSFLEPYAAGVAAVPAEVAAIRQLTADNKPQQDLLDKLEPVAAKRLASKHSWWSRHRSPCAAAKFPV